METIVTGRIFINEEYLNEKEKGKSVRQPSWSLWGSCRRVDMGLLLKIPQYKGSWGVVLKGWADALSMIAFQEHRAQIKFSSVTLSAL